MFELPFSVFATVSF